MDRYRYYNIDLQVFPADPIKKDVTKFFPQISFPVILVIQDHLPLVQSICEAAVSFAKTVVALHAAVASPAPVSLRQCFPALLACSPVIPVHLFHAAVTKGIRPCSIDETAAAGTVNI